MIAALLDMRGAPSVQEAADEPETILTLTPLPKPKPPEDKKAAPAAQPSHAITITIPKSLSTTPNADVPNAQSLGQGLGMALGCSASSYDSLSPAERASCKHGPWGYDAQARETASLIVKAPPPPMSGGGPRLAHSQHRRSVRRGEDGAYPVLHLQDFTRRRPAVTTGETR